MKAKHERFNFKSLQQLRSKITELGVDILLDEDLSPLERPVQIGPLRAPNSLGINPMEGCDGTPEGAPAELTVRRYDRFAAGGYGLVWFEATAVIAEGRANPRQLCMHQGDVGEFAQLVRRTRDIARQHFGQQGMPMLILQLTHSGRYSRPISKPAPIIAFRHPVLDPVHRLPEDYPIVSDDYLEWVEDRFVEAAQLAWQAGFDGVDIKSCHGYLGAELLAARTRPGRYGGSFENRTRFLLNIVEKVRAAVPELLLAVRLNGCDGMEFPHSWGMDQEVKGKLDPEEPIRLVELLYQKGVRLVNVTAGNPYFNPHINRPFDRPAVNARVPDEHPLEGIARLFFLARAIQQAVPEMVVMNSGYSWLRQYAPLAAAANLRNGWAKICGFGREAFAYPTLARDLLSRRPLDSSKLCIACSKCTDLMRADSATGCVVRDASVYLSMFRERCAGDTGKS